MYGREIDDEVTTFGTTGYTFDGVFLLYDRLTESVWFPLRDGAFDAVGGPLLGRRIPYLEKPPITSLGAWRARHANTLVLLGDSGDVPISTAP